MNTKTPDFLIGLLFGAIVFSLLGFAGIRSLISSLRNLAKKKYPPLYNYFGIVTGSIIIVWVLLLFVVLGYLWLQFT